MGTPLALLVCECNGDLIEGRAILGEDISCPGTRPSQSPRQTGSLLPVLHDAYPKVT